MGIYGLCPICGTKGVSRERRLNGDDTCELGHKYPSKNAIDVEKARKDFEEFLMKRWPMPRGDALRRFPEGTEFSDEYVEGHVQLAFAAFCVGRQGAK